MSTNLKLQNCLRRNWMLRQPLFFWYGCLSIKFFNSLTCDLRDAMPRQRSLIPKEEEDFPRGDKHFKHVPPPTYLICLSAKDLYR